MTTRPFDKKIFMKRNISSFLKIKLKMLPFLRILSLHKVLRQQNYSILSAKLVGIKQER